ncbi:DUF397 domain-containing protein [Streptomyces corynorhini]|uniref:DUF397 domain-containing protein n=1 Tax=Streptomyces corynorhini TaxID=2282652 RepID=A0A370B991_9ACTN|nr:DUF397 domain-containing protein [Streptomyces corynorhini]RDG36704.1 DUF397 domain-containing protein [Streptomyces corynorhini]
MATETLLWLKSSYSGNGGSCVEWAPTHATATGTVPVRDSKVPQGPVLLVPAGAFASFVGAVRQGRFDAS